MRLYVQCPLHRRRIYLSIRAERRTQLPYDLNVRCPYCRDIHYHNRDEVYAEPGDGSTVGGAILGGLIGILGGPLGVILGGAAGGALGVNADAEEQRRARRFNEGW